MILTVQRFSTYYPLPINTEIITVDFLYAWSIVRIRHSSAPYHPRYSISRKLISAKFADLSN